MNPSVSVIINTCDRADHLSELLRALDAQTGVAFEVIVVNGPSRDPTPEVLRAWAGRIKTISCPVRSLSASRNDGLTQAAGDVVVFIDDDGRPVDHHWLARYARAASLDADTRFAAWGGAVRIRDSEDLEFERGEVSDYCFLVFFGSCPRPVQGRRWCKSVCGCNMAFRREALLRIGGFDERYAYYAEDVDVCRRLAGKGWGIAHLDDNPVRHFPMRMEGTAHPLDRPWHVIARSDTLFALRHGADRGSVRTLKTLWYAPRKHYVRELNRALRARSLPPGLWLRCITRCVRGVGAGLCSGLLAKPVIRNFPDAPPPFQPFRTEEDPASMMLRNT